MGTGEGLSHDYLRNTKGSSVDVEAIAKEHPEGDGKDLERPRFHVMSRRGWTSDPCGPMFHNGKWVPAFQVSLHAQALTDLSVRTLHSSMRRQAERLSDGLTVTAPALAVHSCYYS